MNDTKTDSKENIKSNNTNNNNNDQWLSDISRE